MLSKPTWKDAAADRIAIDRGDPVRIGMPELCRTGLSENWLWKICGHRHWLALAQAHGLPLPDFRDGEGHRLYPAFIDITLSDGRLNMVAENDVLTFAHILERTGRTRFRSIIAIECNDRLVATMSMETAFVGRSVAGSNRSVQRGLVAAPCALLPPQRAALPFRAREWGSYGGFHQEERQELARIQLNPNPHEDFNGAHFLYFASFQALVDRAEWSLLRMDYPLLSTASRRLIFAGNVELGERVQATFCGIRREENNLSHWIELTRQSDCSVIGLAFTKRRV